MFAYKRTERYRSLVQFANSPVDHIFIFKFNNCIGWWATDEPITLHFSNWYTPTYNKNIQGFIKDFCLGGGGGLAKVVGPFGGIAKVVGPFGGIPPEKHLGWC